MDAEILKKEAQRLKQDIHLQEVLKRIRERAMERLVSIDPAQTNEIIAQQVRVKFCSDVWSELETMINSGQPKRKVTAV